MGTEISALAITFTGHTFTRSKRFKAFQRCFSDATAGSAASAGVGVGSGVGSGVTVGTFVQVVSHEIISIGLPGVSTTVRRSSRPSLGSGGWWGVVGVSGG